MPKHELTILGAKHLLCPLCLQQQSITNLNETTIPPTLQASADKRSLVCEHNHSFDIAKQGYVNLLPVQLKKSLTPGDSKEMVLARKDFLALGYYRPIADALIASCKQQLECLSDTPVILDAGCGEGYYTDHLQQALACDNSTQIIYGFDIAKPAVMEVAKRNKHIHSFVSTIKSIPLVPQSCEIILSVFSPLQPEQFCRLLKQNGSLIILCAGKNHLHQLKSQLYTNNIDYDEDKFLAQLTPYFTLAERTSIQHTMHMNSNDDIMSLLAMTPHFWRTSPEAKKRLENTNQLSVDIDVQLMRFTPKLRKPIE